MTDLKQRIGLTMYHHMTEAITDLNGSDSGKHDACFPPGGAQWLKAVCSVDDFIYVGVL